MIPNGLLNIEGIKSTAELSGSLLVKLPRGMTTIFARSESFRLLRNTAALFLLVEIKIQVFQQKSSHDNIAL